jgi:hypothetical protein
MIPDPPKHLERVKYGAFPGVVRVLLESGALADDTPGLAELAARIASHPDTLCVAPFGEYLDQIGWPCRHDVRLAQRALADLAVPAPLAGVMQAVRACVEGRGGDLVTGQAHAQLASFLAGKLGPGDALALVERLQGATAAAACRPLVAALEAERLEPATCDALASLAFAVRAARDGWLAYHAYRGLPSAGATAAAAALTATPSWQPAELVAWAVELASRPPRIRLVAPEAVRPLASELAAAVGVTVEDYVATYPTGDAIVAFCHRALVACDVLLVAITAADHSVWVRRELEVQHRLFGDWRPHVAMLSFGAPMQASPFPTFPAGDLAGLRRALAITSAASR